MVVPVYNFATLCNMHPNFGLHFEKKTKNKTKKKVQPENKESGHAKLA